MIMIRLRTTSAHAARRPTPKLLVRSPTPTGLAAAEEGKNESGPSYTCRPPVHVLANQRALHAPSGLSQGGNDALPLELEAVDESHRHQTFRLVRSVRLTGGPRYTVGPLEASDSPPQGLFSW
jgi:hypothetical protein